jgi:hypothetical protein
MGDSSRIRENRKRRRRRRKRKEINKQLHAAAKHAPLIEE